MKKNIKINFQKILVVLGVVSTLFFTSCYNDLEPDYPPIAAKPVVSFQSLSYTVAEGEELAITLVTNQVLNDNMDFQLDVVKANSTALDIEDFEIGLPGVDLDWGTKESYRLQFPKFQDSFTFNITALTDDLVEEDEIFYVRITSKGTLNGDVNPSSSTAEIKILQKGSSLIDLNFDWDKPFTFSGTDFTLCQIAYDLDFLLFDDAGNFIDYVAATADCPEVGQIDIEALGAGTYDIAVNLYDNGGLSGAAITPAFDIPVTMSYARGGSVLNGSYVQATANVFNSNSASDPTGVNLKYLVSFTIDANGIVTFLDTTTGSTIATGKNSLPKFAGLKNLPKRVK